jgi:hypothetical protein
MKSHIFVGKLHCILLSLELKPIKEVIFLVIITHNWYNIFVWCIYLFLCRDLWNCLYYFVSIFIFQNWQIFLFIPANEGVEYICKLMKSFTVDIHMFMYTCIHLSVLYLRVKTWCLNAYIIVQEKMWKFTSPLTWKVNIKMSDLPM